MDMLASAFLWCIFYKHFEAVCACKDYVYPWLDQARKNKCRRATSTSQICTCFGRNEHLVIFLVLSRTNPTWGLKFSSFCFFSASLNHAFFWDVCNALSVTLQLPWIRRGQEESEHCRGKFHRERLPASQPTSKRVPFDSLFVLLTDRITLSYTIHERC